MRVMIIGASSTRSKFGNKALRAYVRRGHDVFPVNPHEDEVEGLRTVPLVTDVPGPIDRALFYVPPEVGLTVIEPLIQRGDVAEIWLNPGAESPAIIQRARQYGIEPIQACAIVDIGERPDR